MKKLFSLLVLISILMPSNVYAFDITVGATTWYAWWDAKYEDENYIINPGATTEQKIANSISVDPTFLYGPVISLKFNESFNLTFVYLYGKFEQSNSTINEVGSSGIFMENTQTEVYKRSDSDIALNYRLNDYFKVFAGIKYMAYKAEFSGQTVDINALGIRAMRDKYTGYKKPSAYGPGLGLSVTLPVIENLFILGTLSGFYLWGEEEGSIEMEEIYSSKFGNFNDKFNYKEYGINSNLSIAYYISSISTVISLGGRLQYFKTDCGDIQDLVTSVRSIIQLTDERGIHNGNKTNKIYGITLTATYTFSI